MSTHLVLCAASMMDFIPDAHTLLTVVAGVEMGSPAPRRACRVGACPSPACNTFPMYTSFTSSAGIPACSIAPLIAMEPSFVAGTVESFLCMTPLGSVQHSR
uniref:Uncharacterized protein n=1 Tax=Anguilla anguilla TaxID=7936 RepID=A0A0E9W7H6_ANGAN